MIFEISSEELDIFSIATFNSFTCSTQNILLSMRTLKVELSNTMRQINISANQVSSASGQVSNGAQTLSHGAMQQASSIQELSAQARIGALILTESFRATTIDASMEIRITSTLIIMPKYVSFRGLFCAA